MANSKVSLVYKPKEIGDWFPVMPAVGPPLPKFLKIFWPWYKPELPTLPPTTYTCPTCEAQFSTKAELLAHIAAEHPGEPPVILYTCSICGATFATQEELDAHFVAEHPPIVELDPVIYESMSTNLTGEFTLGQTTMVKVRISNPNAVAVIEDVKISGSGFRELSDNPITITIEGNSVNVARFNIMYDAIGTYTIYCQGLSTTVTIVEGWVDPGLGGVFLVGPGEFYELRNSDGSVRCTAEVTPEKQCYYDCSFVGTDCRNAGTIDYDSRVGYLRHNAAEPGASYSASYAWHQMLTRYYNWETSGLSFEDFKTRYPYWDILGGMELWFFERIPAYCPLTWNP